MAIDAEFLEILACPACKSELVLQGEDRLRCAACRRSYPVRDEIPVLLLDEATLESDDASQAGIRTTPV
jgi:uncharacterized protein YbaR (Trm112 family)